MSFQLESPIESAAAGETGAQVVELHHTVGAPREDSIRSEIEQATSRIALEDLEWRGRAVKCGDELILLLGSANRDEALCEAPDRLDVGRDEVRHLAFGHGLHFCLGAQLARLEAQVALSALLERFPSLRIDEREIEWSGNVVLRSPVRLSLRLD